MAVDAFFYGLYMDDTVPRDAGVPPHAPRTARADLARLYGAPGLEVHRPEEIEVAPENRAIIPARVYNLPHPPGRGRAQSGVCGETPGGDDAVRLSG